MSGFMKDVLKKSRPAEVSKVDDTKIKRNANLFSLHSLIFHFLLFSQFFCSSLEVILRPLVVAKSRCIRVIWCTVLT